MKVLDFIHKNTKITDMTIMPDGRPFYAWNNELKMLRQSELELNNARKRLKREWEILKIVEIESKEDIPTGDLLFRVRRRKMVESMTEDSLVDLYEKE